jgi:hypothetical protein
LQPKKMALANFKMGNKKRRTIIGAPLLEFQPVILRFLISARSGQGPDRLYL